MLLPSIAIAELGIGVTVFFCLSFFLCVFHHPRRGYLNGVTVIYDCWISGVFTYYYHVFSFLFFILLLAKRISDCGWIWLLYHE